MTLLNTTIPRIIGACFYYPPYSNSFSQLTGALSELADLFPWPQPALIRQHAEQISQVDLALLDYDYSVLFEGQGEMPAPPWSSVYLEQDNLLMGESTQRYREFLLSNGVVTDTENPEPDDQFGLMLMAFAYLLESDKSQAAIELLGQYILPWAGRYLQLVSQYDSGQRFYPLLAQIADIYLQTLQQQLDLNEKPTDLYL
ncbi:molecular chaperone [Pragia fontium]|uniref:TorD/DmsD family molecular chaperone n=1 Tax=Pragia fontium TaxID=82985 RepID=UPI00118767F5|nr:molecular chaperone [Pragia fontium]